ncbi:MAG TPA: hypothetical protein VKY32_00825 [Flavobacterium sp.]|nr:hypothetical protein [Flavobacterium sp.]
MKLSKKTYQHIKLSDIFAKHITGKEREENANDLSFMYDIVSYFRPERPGKISHVSISELITYLIEHNEHRIFLANYIKNVLKDREFRRMISDTGILQDSDFLYEVRKRLTAKILPLQPQKETLEYVLNQVFFKEMDYVWLKKIEFHEFIDLFDLLQFKDIFEGEIHETSPLSETLFAMGLITQRMSGRAMESNIIRMVPEYNHLESPFTAFEREFLEVEEKIRSGEIESMNAEDLSYKQLLVLHKQCEDFVERAFKNSAKFGITIKVNQSLLRIRQQLERMKLLLSLLVADNSFERKKKSVNLAVQLIEYNCYKNNVKSLINESTQLISYEITQYNAKTGEHYITQTAKEYFNMFKASLGAGLVVGFLCIFKILLSKINTSDFGFALLYSLNYAFGFILIYLCGFALATKQPAMTATTIIKAVEEGNKNQTKDSDKHSAFANLFARLFRSQFIAFVGNVIMAFPVALLIIWIFDIFSGINIAETKWPTLISDTSPVHSLAIFHAAIAGVFLFLSGIISGNVSNKNKHNQVYYRIQENPVLKQTIGSRRSQKLAQWLEKKWPGIASNFWFGVFMGSAHPIGIFLGLNIDIRHITFVSGNLAIGAYGANFALSGITWFWCILGIVVIGFVNFIVSFGLSLSLALRSRNIPLREMKALFISVWAYFKQNPMKFFFPPKEVKTAENHV